jgi:hypothetical protein
LKSDIIVRHRFHRTDGSTDELYDSALSNPLSNDFKGPLSSGKHIEQKPATSNEFDKNIILKIH